MTDRAGRDGRSRVVNVNWSFRYPPLVAPAADKGVYTGPRTVREVGDDDCIRGARRWYWNYTRRAWV